MSICVVFHVEFDFDDRSAVAPQKSTFSLIFLFLGVRRADFFFVGAHAGGKAAATAAAVAMAVATASAGAENSLSSQ